MFGQGHRPLEGVEVVDGLVPFVLLQARHLIESGMGAGGYDQVVVVQVTVVLGDAHPVLLRLDHLDLGHDHLNPRRNEVAPGLDHVVLAVNAEGDEKEPRLIGMHFIPIHDGDLPFVPVQHVAQFVDNHCPGSSGAQHQ
jgi:hypothetical protein